MPLRVDDRAVGHLVVGDRTGEARFAAGDVRLLETVANHGSVALRNGRLIERLHFEARRDELTGLPNRLHFREILAEAAAAAERGAPCAIMVLDFDGFKAINDTLGHQAGDDLLRVLAGRLAGLAADDAVVARLGGDEFAVLVPGCATAASASTVAGRLLGAFDDPVPVGDAQLRLSGSLGIALAPQHGSTGSELLRAADIAMYAAKAGAGGQRMYTPDRGARSADALGLAADLRDAVGAGQIDVALHPVTDLRTGTLHSVEVRACWRHPRLGEVEPALLLEAAERSGQVAALSALVLDRALLLARRWLDEGRPVPLTVDLAPRLLADAGLPRQVAAALHRHGVPPDLLRLEIQEAGVLSDPRRRLDALERLHATGVRLGLGGFGTGYSSLTYLSRLPVDQLSLDGSFVRRLAGHARDQAVARTVVDLAAASGSRSSEPASRTRPPGPRCSRWGAHSARAPCSPAR